jgi:hypothetical protein
MFYIENERKMKYATKIENNGSINRILNSIIEEKLANTGLSYANITGIFRILQIL